MKIKSIKIDGFKPFQFAGIDNLFLTFESPIHVILGTNGCGKSFLFNEMRFLPTIRANYERNGYKEIEVEHNGHTYTFGLDNSTSKKYYFFLEDGVELNQSGNESIQKDLIEKYLNYTKITEEILHFDKTFSNSEPNVRKQFLKDINPCDLSIVESKRSKVRNICNAAKERIKSLNYIIAECEAKLLSEENRKKIEDEVENLNKQFLKLSNDLAVTNSEISLLEKDYAKDKETYDSIINSSDNPLDASSNKHFSKTLKELKELKIEVDYYFDNLSIDINLETLDKDRDVAIKKYTECETVLKGLIDKANGLAEDIKKYNEYLNATDKKSDISILELKLKSIEEELRSYPNTDNAIEIPEHDFYKYDKIFQDVKDDLETIHTYEIKKLFYPEVIKSIKNKVAYIESILTNYNNDKNRKLKEIEEIKELFTDMPKGPNEILPLCNDCGYQLVYKIRKQELKDKLDKLNKEVISIEHNYNKYSKIAKNLDNIFYVQNTVNNIVNNVIKRLEDTVFKVNNKNNFVDTLNSSIFNYIKYLDNTISLAPILYEKKKKYKEYEETLKQIDSLKSSNTPAKDMIEEFIKNKTIEHKHALEEIFLEEKELAECKRIRDFYSSYRSITGKINERKKTVNKFTRYIDLVHKLFIRYQFSKQIDKKINEVVSQEKSLRAILRDQDYYSNRYKDSLKELEEKNKEIKITTEIFNALSVETGYPKKIVVDYTNSIIKSANYIINSIWSYPIKLQTLTIEDKFEGKIPVQIESIVVPDIKSLSKGQKAIVDFAVIISSIIVARLNNYPLFLDEITNGSFSELHKEKLLSWMRTIIDEKYASQLFVIDHDAYVNNGFRDATMICMKDDGSFNKDNAASKFIKYL